MKLAASYVCADIHPRLIGLLQTHYESSMSTDSSTNVPSPFDDEPQHEVAVVDSLKDMATKPRLSILHLMVWTATSAAMMAVMRLPRETASQVPAFFIVIRIAYAMYGGVVIGGVIMWLARRYRGVPFPTEPGEWLLVAQGKLVLSMLGIALSVSVLERGNYRVELVITALLLGAIAVTGSIPAFFYRKDDPWRWFFWAFAMFCIVPLVTFLLGMLIGFAVVVVLGIFAVMAFLIGIMLFVVAIKSDLNQAVVRGWVHWTGVWSLAFLVTFYFVTIVINVIN